MSRYIDANAVIADINKSIFDIDDKEWYLTLLVNAPSIDIVRCKECRFGQWHEQAEMFICSVNDQDLYEAEHFCSYGEREGE